MPVTADQVQVTLDAEVSQYLSDLNRADKRFAQITANMEREAREVGAAFSTLSRAAVFRGQASPLSPETIDQASNSMRNLGGSTANVAAQFQDIGVQLAGGTSPLLIALQQGTQLSAVFNDLRSNGQRLGPALAGAFASIISPISLATIAVIALGGAAIQYLGGLVPQVETANDAIDRHRKALEGIVEGYDAAEDAVSSYIDSANQLPRNVAIAQIREQFVEIQKEGEKFRQQAATIGGLFVDIGSKAERALSSAASRFATGQISAEEFYLELERIRNTDMSVLDFRLGEVIDRMEQGAIKAIAFGNAIDQLVASTHALAGVGQDEALASFFDENAVDNVLEKLKGLTPELRTQQEIIEETYTKALANPALTDAAREQLRIARDTALAAQTETEARKKAEDAARTAASTAKQSANEKLREREAVQALIEKLTEEAALVGVVGKEKEIAIALSRAGAAATEEERAQIEQLVAFTYDQAAAIKANQKAMSDFLSMGESGLNTFINAILDGKSATEAWGAALNDIGRQLINLGVSSLFSKTGPIAGLFGLDGARASGGPVRAGGSYLVGEKGPEIFTPSSAGNITPNGAMGGASFVFAPAIDNRGADVAAVARLEGIILRMQSEFTGRVRNEIMGKGRKW